MTCERVCEAPVHRDSCPCVGCVKTEYCGLTNVDHHTPKCVAKKLGWKRKQLNKPENKQNLSRPCHMKKDRSTAARKQRVNKGFETLDDLRRWRDTNDTRYTT